VNLERAVQNFISRFSWIGLRCAIDHLPAAGSFCVDHHRVNCALYFFRNRNIEEGRKEKYLTKIMYFSETITGVCCDHYHHFSF